MIFFVFVPDLVHADTKPDAEADAKTDLSVKVKKAGGKVIIDVSMLVSATPQQTWAVLTDYNHMPAFISNLQASKITLNDGNKLHVSQQGKARVAGLSFAFDTLREITLVPHKEIHSRVLGGSIKQADSRTLLSSDSSGTRIVLHSELTISSFIPASIGLRLVDQQMRKQYTELRTEIIKRKNEAPKQ